MWRDLTISCKDEYHGQCLTHDQYQALYQLTLGFKNGPQYARIHMAHYPELGGIRFQIIEYYLKERMKVKTQPPDQN